MTTERTTITDEQLDELEQVAREAVDAAWERTLMDGEYKPIDDPRILNGVNTLFDLITALRQAWTELDAAKRLIAALEVNQDPMSSPDEWRELDAARGAYDAARAGKGEE